MLSCAATEAQRKISTFTVGFDNAQFEDERVYARLAAKHFGSDHHEITITPREFWDFLPTLVWHMEEPICDPPAVSLHYVSKLAREHVKVLLSGEGGDEAFGGYNDYRNFQFLERVKKTIHPMEGVLSGALRLAKDFGPLQKAGKFAPFLTTAYRIIFTAVSRHHSAISIVASRNFIRLIFARQSIRTVHLIRSVSSSVRWKISPFSIKCNTSIPKLHCRMTFWSRPIESRWPTRSSYACHSRSYFA